MGVVAVFVFRLMSMLMFVFVSMTVLMRVSMAVGFDVMPVVMAMIMIGFQMNIEFDAFDAASALARDMKMVIVQAQLPKFMFELVEIDPQINEGAEKHVPTDAAKNVEADGFHRRSPAANALIWLTA